MIADRQLRRVSERVADRAGDILSMARWPLLLALAVAVWHLGVIGFLEWDAAVGHQRPWTDAAYRALVLFTLQGGDPHDVCEPQPCVLPASLDAARFLAPLLTFVSALQAALAILREERDQLRLRRARGHVVVAGLGDKGWLLVQQYRRAGRTVVAIEVDPRGAHVESARRAGALLVLGDAREPTVQRHARVANARQLLAVTQDDGVNAAIAQTAQELVSRRRGGALTCSVHVTDPQLWNLLRELELRGSDTFRSHFVNVYHEGALQLLAEQAATWGHAGADGPPAVVVIGVGRFGSAIAMRAARLWRDQRASPSERMPLYLVDVQADTCVDNLLRRHPRVNEVCAVQAVTADALAAAFDDAPLLGELRTRPGGATVYVCLGDDARAIQVALTVRRLLPSSATPIVVRTRREHGLARFAGRELPGGRASALLAFFPLMERACAAIVRDAERTSNETLAQLSHGEYLRQLAHQGRSPHTHPNMRPWHELSEEARNWNRAQINHIPVKLEAIGCRAVPTLDWDIPLLPLSDAEVDRLARAEHERWLAERRAAGWTWGQKNDSRARTNPNIRAWEELDAKAQELDRAAVREIPAFLARAGFRVERLAETGDE